MGPIDTLPTKRTALVLLMTAAAMLCASPAAAQEKPSPELAVAGVDKTIDMETAVPQSVIDSVNKVYSYHKQRFGVAPPIDTTFKGKPNVFYVIRPKVNLKHDTVAASAGTFKPYDPSGLYTESWIGKVCLGNQPPRSNWCSENAFSVTVNADRAKEWSLDILLSHEFIHLYQYKTISGAQNPKSPFWLVDGQANGVGFGMMERIKDADGNSPFSRRSIARRTKAMQNSNFSFFLGLRYYDRPLDVDRWGSIYPVTHPEYGRESKEVGQDEVSMAGYMTGSFWRHLIRARPRGFDAYKQMLKYPQPADATSSLAWLEWTDTALKAARHNGARIWPGGIRQVYSEMITELADFPDLVAKSRTGKLRADYFDKLLWADGCQKVDLMVATAATVPVTIYPYSTRCLRVKMPYSLVAAGTTDPAAPKDLPAPFNVTAVGSGNCKDLDLGTRGQLVQSPIILDASSGVMRGSGCMAIWQAGFLPLAADAPGGLEGWQTVVLTNAPSTFSPSQVPAKFTLNFVRPVAKTNLTGVRNTMRGGKKTKKPLPRVGAEDPQMSTPQLNEIDPDAGLCPPEEAALFECGDLTQITIAAGPDAVDFARATEAIQKGIALQYLPGSFTKDGFMTLGEIFQEANPAAKTPEIMQRMAMDEPNGASVIVAMARLAEGQTGTFPAKISVGVGEGDEISSLAPGQTETDASGCVNIMSYETTGQVTITMNAAGMLVGRLSATLYQDNNSDVPEETCRMPRERVGSVTADFTTPGSFSVGPNGDYQVDLSRIEEQAEFDRELLAQINTPLEERSDILPEDEMSDETRRQLAAYEASGSKGGPGVLAGSATCDTNKLTQRDMIGFFRAVSSPEDMAEMTDAMLIAQLGAIGADMFKPFVCDWITAGRPRQWEVPGSGEEE